MRRKERSEIFGKQSKSTEELFRILQIVESKLDNLLKLVVWFAKKESEMLEVLAAEVARNRAVDESAKALIMGIKEKLDELASQPKVDPAEVAALAAELGSSSDELAAAVTANTPVDPDVEHGAGM
jgi:cell division FtsZ-interacting protein ZapD